jgi:hypothetical protein
LGSLTGLVTFSHLLSYLIKKYKTVTYASILGFIVGSLGVVWPWKNAIPLEKNGQILVDRSGNPMIATYKRYIPEFNVDTIWAVIFMIVGVLIVLGLEKYGESNKS